MGFLCCHKGIPHGLGWYFMDLQPMVQVLSGRYRAWSRRASEEGASRGRGIRGGFLTGRGVKQSGSRGGNGGLARGAATRRPRLQDNGCRPSAASLVLLRAACAAGGFCDSKRGLLQRDRHLHNHTRPRTLDPCVEVFTHINGGSLCSPSEHCLLSVLHRRDRVLCAQRS